VTPWSAPTFAASATAPVALASAARNSAGAADAIANRRRAIDLAERYREMAKANSDFDPIRDEPALKGLVIG
jgi:hypothetical protein